MPFDYYKSLSVTCEIRNPNFHSCDPENLFGEIVKFNL